VEAPAWDTPRMADPSNIAATRKNRDLQRTLMMHPFRFRNYYLTKKGSSIKSHSLAITNFDLDCVGGVGDGERVRAAPTTLMNKKHDRKFETIREKNFP
jgi:hypothetical protein